MSNKIIFRMVAWTDAAGKYDPSAPLAGNEDNYYADDDLSDNQPSHIVADEDITLSDCGMIMAVADGMGGMNAGEVASQIAHDTVAEYFAPGRVTPQLASSHESRSRYMENVIREADKRIKDDGKRNRAHHGMGSTLIMAWLAGNELSVTWIGDSRAYLFNPRDGIMPISKDHSYVQELVDKGVITYEQTFEHPQGNIITRSLGDSSKKAKPESRLVRVHDGDIILLCSDGLSGVLRDRPAYDETGNSYDEENLEEIIAAHTDSLTECRQALWEAAERSGWYDNVTAILCQIRGGAGQADEPRSGEIESLSEDAGPTSVEPVKKNSKNKLLAVLLLIVVVAAVGCGLLYWNRTASTELQASESKQVAVDSTERAKTDTDTSKTVASNGRNSTTSQKKPKKDRDVAKDNNEPVIKVTTKPKPDTQKKDTAKTKKPKRKPEKRPQDNQPQDKLTKIKDKGKAGFTIVEDD